MKKILFIYIILLSQKLLAAEIKENFDNILPGQVIVHSPKKQVVEKEKIKFEYLNIHKKPLKEWSEDDVQDWLSVIFKGYKRLSAIKKIFLDNQIDGNDLVTLNIPEKVYFEESYIIMEKLDKIINRKPRIFITF